MANAIEVDGHPAALEVLHVADHSGVGVGQCKLHVTGRSIKLPGDDPAVVLIALAGIDAETGVVKLIYLD